MAEIRTHSNVLHFKQRVNECERVNLFPRFILMATTRYSLRNRTRGELGTTTKSAEPNPPGLMNRATSASSSWSGFTPNSFEAQDRLESSPLSLTCKQTGGKRACVRIYSSEHTRNYLQIHSALNHLTKSLLGLLPSHICIQDKHSSIVSSNPSSR